MKRSALALALLCTGCSQTWPFCGQSFCLTEKPSSVSRKVGPDFDIYDVAYNKQRFVIYEGNAPTSVGGDRDLGVAPEVPPGFIEGKLYESRGSLVLALRTPEPRFPQYVAVSAASNDPRDLDDLVPKLRAKQPICRDCPH